MRQEREHPSYAQVDAVATAFEELARVEDHKLDMHAPYVFRGQSGTIASHGGWYLYHKHTQGLPWPESCYDDQPTDEAYGYDHMATTLGFRNTIEMSEFFERHPEIWGNTNADQMMRSCRAFEETPEWLTLEHVARHCIGGVGMLGNKQEKEQKRRQAMEETITKMRTCRRYRWAMEDRVLPPADLTLEHVAQHWRGIAERIRKMGR